MIEYIRFFQMEHIFLDCLDNFTYSTFIAYFSPIRRYEHDEL